MLLQTRHKNENSRAIASGAGARRSVIGGNGQGRTGFAARGLARGAGDQRRDLDPFARPPQLGSVLLRLGSRAAGRRPLRLARDEGFRPPAFLARISNCPNSPRALASRFANVAGGPGLREVFGLPDGGLGFPLARLGELEGLGLRDLQARVDLGGARLRPVLVGDRVSLGLSDQDAPSALAP
ncbi:MAG: hypothetical protein Fur0037_25990 [Planctomycetota bacterium]